MRSADFWTGVLIHTPGKEVFDTLTNTLSMSNERYRDNMSVGHYHRLLLALAATVANPDAGSNAHTASLRLCNILFTFNPTILEVMPWKVVRHVAAATEMWLPQLLYPSDDGPASYLNWSTILDSLSILVRCCSAPVPSWTWSQEETKVFAECITDFFRKESLSILTAGRLWSSWNARKLLAILDLVLTYLSEFEDARRWAPRDLLEAVAELVAYVEASRASESYLDLEDSDEDDVLEGLGKVKHNLEKCRSLELGVGSDEERIQDPLPDLKPDTGAMSVHSAGE
ncbi:hypothetical protein DICSQDRAFT_130237 [Dichomitus squalens LYAD-421 SS1]|uniref:Uncharacterized protein n=1 Tax=Dichomitus squalens (strain LYAD-421) TaxID=732165 RepID=R7SJ15_DICSQ|nr:uncharacterized protein DICSQDRAFT_130237 [Dichomitus squalens LYAD-421 SS1]EJF56146.1 hypothetical protein DICSQDRAFT_130237 [Dichomitus squalens LYAD-421 SS1]